MIFIYNKNLWLSGIKITNSDAQREQINAALTSFNNENEVKKLENDKDYDKDFWDKNQTLVNNILAAYVNGNDAAKKNLVILFGNLTPDAAQALRAAMNRLFHDIAKDKKALEKLTGKPLSQFNKWSVSDWNGSLTWDIRNFHNFRSYHEKLGELTPKTELDRQTSLNLEESINRSSRTFSFLNNDFKFSEHLQNMSDLSNIQSIILNEYQPYHQVKQFSVKNAWATGIANALGLTSVLKALQRAFETSDVVATGGKLIAAESTNNIINAISVDPAQLWNIGNGTDSANPWSIIKDLFSSGEWLNTYELPFFGDNYLVSDQYKNWRSKYSTKKRCTFFNVY